MNFSVVYLANRFVYRIFDFFHHWYVDGSRMFGRKFIGALMELDKTFAVRVTLKHFFEPLYKDYTVIGRIMGAIFRTFRVLIGAVVYAVIAVVAVALYVAWISIPLFVAWKIIKG
jgi:exosome complex RNA-binding protein Rrp4